MHDHELKVDSACVQDKELRKLIGRPRWNWTIIVSRINIWQGYREELRRIIGERKFFQSSSSRSVSSGSLLKRIIRPRPAYYHFLDNTGVKSPRRLPIIHGCILHDGTLTFNYARDFPFSLLCPLPRRFRTSRKWKTYLLRLSYSRVSSIFTIELITAIYFYRFFQ